MVGLCECQTIQCQTCSGDRKPPFYYYDEKEKTLLPCACRDSRLKLAQATRRFKESNIPWKFRARPMSDFKVDSPDPEEAQVLLTALDSARQFLLQFKEDSKAPTSGLYFFGPPGVGKSFLGSLILNQLIIDYEVDVYFMKITRDFFNRIRATFNKDASEYGQAENYFNALAQKPVLMIDDFGIQSDTDWEQRTLYDLIDIRYEYERPTILTSNINPEEYKKFFNGRIYSRLKEMAYFEAIITRDYRDNLVPKNSHSGI